ncbi:NAD(P)H-binding protein [Polyangium sp. 15x6]|uniref:NmrA family NAD(P)-binding protein n=1 Tax=Polyangium sp. 15x6 TaxID=3042687 RepID=UPI00249AF2F8|nr:NAD(P)H-binding protein [Polyangium sp. 15x6]MDI3285671.1 NAD(P)H-binding protein [Polyangium sp. 15x6]
MHVIFGSSGVVGSAVLAELHRKGLPTRGVYRSRKPSPHASEVARVDLETGEGLDASLAGATTVFLATGDMIDQVAAELRVASAARRAGALRIVKLSIMSAESEAFFYARVHRAIERGVEASGIAYTLLRPGGFMQNFIHYYGHAIRTEGVLRLPCDDFEENVIDARDIAQVAAECLASNRFEGQALTLCGPQPISYSAMVAEISALTGRKVTFESISPDAFREAMLPYAVSREHVDGITAMLRFHQEGRGPKTSDAVLEVTGKPPRSFEAFAREHASSWVP